MNNKFVFATVGICGIIPFQRVEAKKEVTQRPKKLQKGTDEFSKRNTNIE